MRLVLRPNLLSIYRDEEETQLRHQINLSEVTAVALRRDRKRKGEHAGVFGIFSPSRNFHLEAEAEPDAKLWVDLIRREARMDEEDHQNMTVTSPGGSQAAFIGFGRPSTSTGTVPWTRVNRASSEASDPTRRSRSASGVDSIEPISSARYRKRNDLYELSGNETGSYSDFSDLPAFGSLGDITATSSHGLQRNLAVAETVLEDATSEPIASRQVRNRNDFYMIGKATDQERVIWHGYLRWLKSHSGMRQWKKYWVVLRLKSLTLYKNEEVETLILEETRDTDSFRNTPLSSSFQSLQLLMRWRLIPYRKAEVSVSKSSPMIVRTAFARKTRRICRNGSGLSRACSPEDGKHLLIL